MIPLLELKDRVQVARADLLRPPLIHRCSWPTRRERIYIVVIYVSKTKLIVYVTQFTVLSLSPSNCSINGGC